MTNADRIRAMTDEEFADIINVFAPENDWTWWLHGGTWLDWLKQEVNNEHSD